MLSFVKNLNKWKLELIAIGFSCWGLFLRYLSLLHRDLWSDEKYSLSCIQGSLKNLLWELHLNGERSCFPGYYYLTWPFAQIFKDNKWGINLPHIIITILGFYFFYLICRRYLKSFIAFGMAFYLFAANSNLIFHAFEFRPYAVLPTIALGVLFFMERFVEDGYRNQLKQILLFLLFLLSVVYHPYGLLIIGLSFIYVVVRNRILFNMEKYKYFLRFFIVFFLISIPVFLF